MSNYHGHGTRPDGSHVLFTADEAKAIYEASEAAAACEAEMMPDTDSVLRMTTSITNRLRKLGWSEGMYCPKGGEDFAVITSGCSAILKGCYIGTWPTGEIHALDGSYHHGEIWWKALDKLTDGERAKMERDMEFNIACIEGLMTRMADLSDLLDNHPK